MDNIFAISLKNGKTIKGVEYLIPDARKDVVIQTGMNEHATRYERFALYLNDLGYSVYVLDAFAQGVNAPTVDDLEKWVPGDFEDNVEALHVKTKELRDLGHYVVLMGHSMGSFMTQSYLERFPNTVDKVIICGSNGPNKATLKLGYAVARLVTTKKNWNTTCKLLDNLALGAYSKAIKDRKTDLDWLSYNEENVNKYDLDPYCGHQDTRGFWHEFLKGMAGLYDKKNLARISPDEKIMIISGDGDPVGNMGKGPKKLEEMYKSLGVKEVELHIYPHMRHEILNEKDNKVVLEDIKKWLSFTQD